MGRVQLNYGPISYSQVHGMSSYGSISAMLKVPDGTFSWKWFKSLAQRSDLNLVGSTWSTK